MQDRLEIHFTEDSTTHLLKIIKLKGPQKEDLSPKGGFYISARRSLVLTLPKQRPKVFFREESQLTWGIFRRLAEQLEKTIAELSTQGERICVPIEREKIKRSETWMLGFNDFFSKEKVKETEPRMKKQRKENKGIVVTISDDPFPEVTYIQALTPEKLPKAYLNSYLPKVWLSEDRLLWGPNLILLQKKVPYSHSEISNALLHIRLAGEHLAAINKPEKPDSKLCQAATFKDGRFI